MKKIFLIFSFIFLFFNKSYAASATGEATEYQVTMEKVELCEDSACSSSTTVGEVDKTVDIASSDSGADVANYAATTGLPLGKTFSHLRTTISRTFTITGSVDTGAEDLCYTDGGTDHVRDQLLTGKTSESAVSTTMYLSDESFYDVEDGSEQESGEIEIDYSSPTYATSMTISGDSALLIYKLDAPYTIGLRSPLIKVSFGTKNAIGAEDTACIMWVAEPLVSISLL